MIKKQILLWKTIEANRRFRVRVRVRFLFYSELVPTERSCTILWTLLERKKYEAMSGKHPFNIDVKSKASSMINLMNFATCLISQIWSENCFTKNHRSLIELFLIDTPLSFLKTRPPVKPSTTFFNTNFPRLKPKVLS